MNEIQNYMPGTVPVGGKIDWFKSLTGTPPLPDGWVECNGQTLTDAVSPYNGTVIPNLNGSGGGTQRFIRGGTASGATGGSDSHTHTISSSSFSISGTGTTVSAATATGSTSTLPSYYTMVMVMRVR